MPKAKITFKKLIQDSQNYGSNDEHMVSRAFFSIEVDGTVTNDAFVDIKQPVGSDFESSSLEISKAHNYKGPFNHEEFSKLTEAYYRILVGSQGSGIHISGGESVRMRNNTFVKELSAEIEVSNENPAW